MTEKRYNQLMNRKGRLTAAELQDGWHFCYEWDGLLIQPTDPEAKFCRCQEFVPPPSN